MTFVHFALLALAPLAAIPILIHILSRRRLPTIELSTFRFLFDSYVQQRRGLRFQDALLAALRALFVLALVVAIARPESRKWRGLFPGEGARRIVLVLDCSASMGLATNGVTSLDRAKDAARAVVQQLRPDDRVALARMTSRGELLLEEYPGDSKELEPAILRVAPSVSVGDVWAALRMAAPTNADGRLIYLFTDLQKTNWKSVASAAQPPLGAEDRFYALQVGPPTPPRNLAVVGDPVLEESREAPVGLPIETRARVVNFSDQPAEAMLRLEIDGRPVARESLALPPGGSASPTFAYVPQTSGASQARWVIDGDAFELDDEYRFRVAVAPTARVALISSQRSDAGDFGTTYLQAALQAPGAVASASQANPFVVDDWPMGRWKPESLADLAVIVLVDNLLFPKNMRDDLRTFVEGGGGLLVLPGDRARADAYEELLASPGANRPPLCPILLGPRVGDPKKSDAWSQLGKLDFNQPLWRLFEGRKEPKPFASTRVYRHWTLKPDPYASVKPTVLATFADGALALVEGRLGRGTVMVSAFPFDPRWTNLPLKPEFAPLVLRMMETLGRPANVRASAAVAPEALATIQAPAELPQPQTTVTPPGQSPVPVPLTRAGAEWIGKFDATDKLGFYRVELAAATPDRPTRATTDFAVNLAPAESDFARATPDEIADWLRSDRTRVIDLSTSEVVVADELNQTSEVWRWVIGVALAIFVIEFLMATRGPRRRPSAGGRRSWFSRLTGME